MAVLQVPLKLISLVVLLAMATAASAQTTTYHLHKEASSTSGLEQLKTAGPDATSAALLSANLKSAAAGEYLIQAFDSQSGDPTDSGTITSGSTVSFTLWIRKTANLGTMAPRAKLFLNSSSGTQFCTATGSTALTTTVTKVSLSCNTSAAITMAATDRFYLWVGVNLTGTSSSNTFQGELDIEGTLNGNFDSLVPMPVPAAVITTLTPTSGPVGQSITFAGRNFGLGQGSSTVTFNSGKTTTPTSWSPTQIVAPVPSGAITGNTTVTVGGKASNVVSFTVLPTPSITNIAPVSGTAGTAVVITGTNFGATQGSSTVTFNGTAVGTISSSNWIATKITASAPAGVSTGPAVVTVSGVPSNGGTCTAAPVISSLSPNSGAVNSLVVIAGTNFGASQGTGKVTFNSGKVATIAAKDRKSVV